MPTNQQAAKVSSAQWSSDDRGASVEINRFVKERVVEQYLDPRSEKAGLFSLYYFIKDRSRAERERDKKTILFITGGPGEIVWASGVNFVDLEGYRVVYFHLRGSGFSQIPSSNEYDKYLRTDYALDDIEKIRLDLKIDRWAAVIGHSYGAVLAHKYAKMTEKAKSIDKLVLSAPLSRHVLVDETLQFESLRQIYQTPYFNFLDEIQSLIGRNDLREYIVDEAKRVSGEVEKAFGSVQYVIDVFGDKKRMEELGRLNYGYAFFRALRRLRQTGWLPFDENLSPGVDLNVDSSQRACGLVIGMAVLDREGVDRKQALYAAIQKAGARWKKRLKTPMRDFEEAKMQLSKKVRQGTPRVFYVMSVYDGVNERFLKALALPQAQAGSSADRLTFAIGKAGGSRQGNDFLKKMGFVSDQVPVAWDPENYAHRVPTLILKGGADPVTEGKQAERYFEKGLLGEHMLIEFPGIGHAMTLPALEDGRAAVKAVTFPVANTGKGGSKTIQLPTRAALIRHFIENDLRTFRRHPIIGAIEQSFAALFRSVGRTDLKVEVR